MSRPAAQVRGLGRRDLWQGQSSPSVRSASEQVAPPISHSRHASRDHPRLNLAMQPVSPGRDPGAPTLQLESLRGGATVIHPLGGLTTKPYIPYSTSQCTLSCILRSKSRCIRQHFLLRKCVQVQRTLTMQSC